MEGYQERTFSKNNPIATRSNSLSCKNLVKMMFLINLSFNPRNLIPRGERYDLQVGGGTYQATC